VEVVCDLVARTVHLAEPDDLGRFNVRMLRRPELDGDGWAAELASMLDTAGAGRLDDGGDALVRRDWLRRSAASGGVGPDWEERFQAMCRFAESKGWVTASDGSIRGHVVRDDAGPPG
jgi:hypothetical protein